MAVFLLIVVIVIGQSLTVFDFRLGPSPTAGYCLNKKEHPTDIEHQGFILCIKKQQWLRIEPFK